MNSQTSSKRKLYELIVLAVLGGLFYFLYPNPDAVILFSFGFIWNWTAASDVKELLENRRYRMSMIRLVFNLQKAILKPFYWAPVFFKKILSILPAGLFWSFVILINESEMPWWSTFIGSLAFELMQIEINYLQRHKENL